MCLCVLLDFAHPTMIAGYPFKGGERRSTGELLHPEIRRFNLWHHRLYVPPHPEKNPYAEKPVRVQETFGDAMMKSFGSQVLNVSNPNCRKMLENFKMCFENHKVKGYPESACAFY